ncbi:MAG: hypothetical protein Q9173_003824 [Seirophora scorigena]
MLPATNNTAPDCDSIRKGLDEKTFRNTIAALRFASKDLPSDSRVYAVDEWERQHHLDGTSQRRLSLKDEQRLADDLAYVAASREGEASERSCGSSTLETVIKLSRQRIHGRLRLKHWEPPKHRHWKPPKDKLRSGLREAPLHQDLLTLLPELRKNPRTRQYCDNLESLCEIYREVDGDFADHHRECQQLDRAVQSSFDLCQSITTDTPSAVASIATSQASSSNTPLHNLRLESLSPYLSTRLFNPYTMGSVDYYVHAEVQLITFYDLTPSLKALAPRVLGVSKWACYLCNLFVSLHGKYFISKTHGRLYHQWPVPNLASMSTAQRRKYRKILQDIHRLCKAAALKSFQTGRSYPRESAYDFHAHGISSPIAASTASPISSQNTIRAPSTGPQVQDLVSNKSAAMELTAVIPSAGQVPVPDTPGSPSDPPSEVRYESADEGKERGVCVFSPQHAESQTPTTSASLAANADPADCLLKHTITHQKPYHLDLHDSFSPFGPPDCLHLPSPSLSRTLSDPIYQSRWDALAQDHSSRLSTIRSLAEPSATDSTFNLSYLTSRLRHLLPPTTIFAIEAVILTAFVADQLLPSLPGTFLHCGGGGLGWSGRAALGIKLAAGPHRFVWQIVGDGTFLFSVPRLRLLDHPGYAAIAKAAAGGNLWAGTAGTTQELEALESVKGGVGAVLDAHLDGPQGKYGGGKSVTAG